MEPNYNKAKDLASQILSEAEIKSPPIAVLNLAILKGLKVDFMKMYKDVGQLMSGVFDAKNKTIYVNSDDHPNRQAFTIAHELGHYVLDHKPSEYDFLPRQVTVVNSSPEEKEANCFAANLLIPKDMLDEAIKKYSLNITNDIDVLANLFGVSKEFMKYRIDGLQWQD